MNEQLLTSQASNEPTEDRRWLLTRVWAGDVPLWMTYWFFCFLGHIVLSGISRQLAFHMQRAELNDAWVLGALGFQAFIWAYTIAVCVAVWRSSSNYEGPAMWKVLARTLAAIPLIPIGMGVLRFWGIL